MASTVFIDFSDPKVNAAWLNDVNAVTYRTLVGGSGVTITPGPGTLTFSAAGGALTNFVESYNDVVPNDFVAVSSLQAIGAATDIDIVLSPKGGGAILAQTPDSTSSGGDKRGGLAVDFQISRTASTMVASGSFSTIVGGQNNAATGQYSVVAGGYINAANGNYSAVSGGLNCSCAAYASVVAGGENNSAGGTYSVVSGGGSNSAVADLSVVAGGTSNTASGYASCIPGGVFGHTKGIAGAYVYGGGGNMVGAGTDQFGKYLLKRITTDATSGILTTNLGSAAASNQITIAPFSVYRYTGSVVARSTTNLVSVWDISGVITRNSLGVLVFVGTPANTLVAQDVGAAAWTVAVSIDSAIGCLRVTVTGAAATTIRWNSIIDTNEVTAVI